MSFINKVLNKLYIYEKFIFDNFFFFLKTYVYVLRKLKKYVCVTTLSCFRKKRKPKDDFSHSNINYASYILLPNILRIVSP